MDLQYINFIIYKKQSRRDIRHFAFLVVKTKFLLYTPSKEKSKE